MDRNFSAEEFFSFNNICNDITGYELNNKLGIVFREFRDSVHNYFLRDYACALLGTSICWSLSLTIKSIVNEDLLDKDFINLISACGISAILVIVFEFFGTKKTLDDLFKSIEKNGYNSAYVLEFLNKLLNQVDFSFNANDDDCPEFIVFEIEGEELIVENDFYLQRINEQIDRLNDCENPTSARIIDKLIQLSYDYAYRKLGYETNSGPVKFLLELIDLTAKIDNLLKNKGMSRLRKKSK